MSTVIINGLATSYEIIGNGKTVLYLHGWGDSKETFKQLAKLLDCRTVLVDLPGFGGTEPPKSAWGLDDYANYIDSFCKKLNINPDIVVGHSNGGAVAIKAISLGLLKPQGLVLLASAGIRNNQTVKKNTYKLLAKVAKTGLKVIPKQKSAQIKNKVYKKIGSDINVAPHMEATFKKVISQDILDDASNIKIRTLILYGDLDKATPKEYGDLLVDNITNSRLVIIKGCGHFLHHDNPTNVSIEMREFIDAIK